MSPKGVGRYSQATERDINVAQGCRTVLTGNGMEHKCRPRVSDGTHGRREGAKTLLESGRNKMRGGKILSGPRYLCGLELLSRGKDRFLEYSCQVHIGFKLRKFHESLRIIVMIDHFTDSVDFLLGLVLGLGFGAWFSGLGLGACFWACFWACFFGGQSGIYSHDLRAIRRRET